MLRVLEERDEWKSKYDGLEIEMKGMRERVKTSLDFLSRFVLITRFISPRVKWVCVFVLAPDLTCAQERLAPQILVSRLVGRGLLDTYSALLQHDLHKREPE